MLSGLYHGITTTYKTQLTNQRTGIPAIILEFIIHSTLKVRRNAYYNILQQHRLVAVAGYFRICERMSGRYKCINRILTSLLRAHYHKLFSSTRIKRSEDEKLDNTCGINGGFNLVLVLQTCGVWS